MGKIDAGSLEYMRHRAATFVKLPRRMRRKHVKRERHKHLRDLPILFEVLVLLHGRVCQACGAKYDLTIDHILPVIKGGRTTIENLQILCRHCNQFKDADIMDCREDKNNV
jgi:5-methylcytosine-specific restriction endonuclease McrA